MDSIATEEMYKEDWLPETLSLYLDSLSEIN